MAESARRRRSWPAVPSRAEQPAPCRGTGRGLKAGVRIKPAVGIAFKPTGAGGMGEGLWPQIFPVGS